MLQMRLGPSLPALEEIPEGCRNELVGWNLQPKRVAELLMELLSEGLDGKPAPAALEINIGDMLQIMSNDQYRRGDREALANPLLGPRVSIANLFTKELDGKSLKNFYKL
ncbi:unnamed protein product [Dovyalis caffra]|uniref:Isopenicillin N synthase-like Fe(2+) 2OG dioxygenase domain-containing protein n=1 Tax=Dovyalis caffra TaxID=77055 RepID=A0AAV1R302_9ROSI|nr:unnamed protein product [Dovyalis caffra]